MDLSNKHELSQALDWLLDTLGLDFPTGYVAEYLKGKAPHEPLYEKYSGGPTHLRPAVLRHAVVAKSYLAQPNLTSFYDIYRSGRAIPMVRVLARDLQLLRQEDVGGLHDLVQRLSASTTFDELEATVFEVASAATYLRHPRVERVEFLHTKEHQSPEFLAHSKSSSWAVECKKYNRLTGIYGEERDRIRSIGHPLIQSFREKGNVIVEATITSPVCELTENALEAAAHASYPSGSEQRDTRFVVRAFPAPDFDSGTATLFPSPYYYNRYFDYRSDRQWQGIVTSIDARWLGPSFIESVRWHAALKWRVLDDSAIWKKQKLGFSRIFEGMDQLAGWGDERILHVCFERDLTLGPRNRILLDFLERSARKGLADLPRENRLSWLIFNELSVHVNVGGFFDFREHAHFVSGLNQTTPPPVNMVFVSPSDRVNAAGPWGVGPDLPELK